MNIQYHFVHLSDDIKEKVREYADKRFQNIEKLLSHYQEDNKMLKVDIEYQERHNQFKVKATLDLAGKRLHHEEDTHNYMEAIDNTEANLMRQAKKHIDHLRTDKGKVIDATEEAVEDGGRDINYDNI